MKNVFDGIKLTGEKKVLEGWDGKWYIMIEGIGRVGPFDTKEEAEKEMNS